MRPEQVGQLLVGVWGVPQTEGVELFMYIPSPKMWHIISVATLMKFWTNIPTMTFIITEL